MSFADTVKQHAEKVNYLRELVKNEGQTKQALIEPFFRNVLSYDVDNPLEFEPEHGAIVADKKLGSVDYAIHLDGKLELIIEAKHIDENLDAHFTQLFKYFAYTKAKFAILTNGIEYRFYTDIEAANKMDLTPFLVIDFSCLKDEHTAALSQFRRSGYSGADTHKAAKTMKRKRDIKEAFRELLENPSDDFTRTMISASYKSIRIDKPLINEFRRFVKDAVKEYIEDEIKNRFIIAGEIGATTPPESEDLQSGCAPEALYAVVSEMFPEDKRWKLKLNDSEMRYWAYYPSYAAKTATATSAA